MRLLTISQILVLSGVEYFPPTTPLNWYYVSIYFAAFAPVSHLVIVIQEDIGDAHRSLKYERSSRKVLGRRSLVGDKELALLPPSRCWNAP